MNEVVRNLYGGILEPPQKGIARGFGHKEIRLEAGSWVVYRCLFHGERREGTFKTLDEAYRFVEGKPPRLETITDKKE